MGAIVVAIQKHLCVLMLVESSRPNSLDEVTYSDSPLKEMLRMMDK